MKSKKPFVVIRLCAFSKDTSGSFTDTVRVTSVGQFKKAEKEFDKTVPFSRFYIENEYLDGSRKLWDACEKVSMGGL